MSLHKKKKKKKKKKKEGSRGAANPSDTDMV